MAERLVFCRKLGRQAPGLSAPPLPGPLGDEIYESVSAQAWAEWEELQLKIINEYHLDLTEAEDRQKLVAQLRAHLNLNDGAQVDALEVGTPTD